MVRWSCREVSCSVQICAAPAFSYKTSTNRTNYDYTHEIVADEACKHHPSQTSSCFLPCPPFTHKHYLYHVALPSKSEYQESAMSSSIAQMMLEVSSAVGMNSMEMMSSVPSTRDPSPRSSASNSPAMANSPTMSSPSISPPLSPISGTRPPPTRLRSLSKLQIPFYQLPKQRLLPPRQLPQAPSPLTLDKETPILTFDSPLAPKLLRANSFKPTPAEVDSSDSEAEASPSPSPFEHLKRHLLVPRRVDQISPLSNTYNLSATRSPVSPMSCVAMAGTPSPVNPLMAGSPYRFNDTMLGLTGMSAQLANSPTLSAMLASSRAASPLVPYPSSALLGTPYLSTNPYSANLFSDRHGLESPRPFSAISGASSCYSSAVFSRIQSPITTAC
ncbi:hypothetical protein BJ878DRAFT_180483 [Calycina marina]|uniref:Uncharacterized protein n=1 Tax=Calycina marina TaxID=1763456 RepID=A0A9P7YYV1_9HELO|nr:hypothetical protein BJ878DRAFT_180483 [Calycina marina]